MDRLIINAFLAFVSNPLDDFMMTVRDENDDFSVSKLLDSHNDDEGVSFVD